MVDFLPRLYYNTQENFFGKEKEMKQKVLTFMVVLAVALGFATFMGPVNVKAAAVKLNKTELNLDVGEKVKLKVKNTKKTIKWKSDNTAVAKVTKNGNVTGISEGECTVTAKVGKKTLTCKVVVKDSVLATLDTNVEIKGVEIPINSQWEFSGVVKADDLYQYSISEEDFKWICAQVAELSEGESAEMTASEENFLNSCSIVSEAFMKEFDTKDVTTEVVKTGDTVLGRVAGICQSNGNDIPIVVYLKITDNKLIFVMGMEIGEPDAMTERIVRTICKAAVCKE